jgi:hypothetical protein
MNIMKKQRESTKIWCKFGYLGWWKGGDGGARGMRVGEGCILKLII